MRTATIVILLLTGLVCWAGCSVDAAPLISLTSPLNGATGVAINAEIRIHAHKDVTFVASAIQANEGIALYDITGGAKSKPKATIDVAGSGFLYKVSDALKVNRVYQLVMKKASISGENYIETDGTVWPEEWIEWPYKLTFSTASAPTVRAAYLKFDKGSSRVVLHFSQSMDMVATGKALQVLDGITYAPLTIKTPVWPSDKQVELTVSNYLEPASLYYVKVDSTARAADNTWFDGNQNGKPGEKNDATCVKFAGSQTIIFSRLGKDKQKVVPCPNK